MSVLHEGLIERASNPENQEPVTESEPFGDHATIFRAVLWEGSRVYRCDIQTADGRFPESEASVRFYWCYPNADHEKLREWTSVATGRLHGPQNLKSWEPLFTCFNAALGEYYDNIEGEVRCNSGGDA